VTFLFVLAGWIFSLCLHEFAHARVAYAGGDTSVRDKGYLDFNPLRYADPVHSLIVPVVFLILGGIALPGGAVYIERHRLRGRGWEAAVSAAGPAANLALAAVIGLAVRSLPPTAATAALAFLGYLQVMAVLFNLLPFPPFDGFGILEPYLGPGIRLRARRFGRWSIWVILALFWFVDPVAHAFWSLVSGLAAGLGIPPDLVAEGWRAFSSVTRGL